MKALVGAFNQEKALIGAFSVIVKTDCGTDGSLYSTSPGVWPLTMIGIRSRSHLLCARVISPHMQTLASVAPESSEYSSLELATKKGTLVHKVNTDG